MTRPGTCPGGEHEMVWVTDTVGICTGHGDVVWELAGHGRLRLESARVARQLADRLAHLVTTGNEVVVDSARRAQLEQRVSGAEAQLIDTLQARARERYEAERAAIERRTEDQLRRARLQLEEQVRVEEERVRADFARASATRIDEARREAERAERATIDRLRLASERRVAAFRERVGAEQSEDATSLVDRLLAELDPARTSWARVPAQSQAGWRLRVPDRVADILRACAPSRGIVAHDGMLAPAEAAAIRASWLAWRADAGMSQRDASKLWSCSRSALATYETGRAGRAWMTKVTCYALLRILIIGPDNVASDEGDMPSRT